MRILLLILCLFLLSYLLHVPSISFILWHDYFQKITLADLRYCLRVGKLSLEAVSTKIDTTRPTQKLDRCLKFRNDLNLPVFFFVVSLF